MKLWRRRAAVVAAATLLGSCGDADEPKEARTPIEIVAAAVEDDIVTLTVGVCGDPFSIDLQETDSEVVIFAYRHGERAFDSDSCAEGATVELSRPIGDRALIDGSTGSELGR